MEQQRRLRRLRLHHRIVIPFVIVAVTATAGVAVVTLAVTSGALRARMQAQLMSASEFVSRSDMAVNRLVLANVHDITGAHVLTFGPGGELVAATVDDGQAVTAAVRPLVASMSSETQGPVPVWTDCGVPCLVVLNRLQTRAGYVVALVAETQDVAAANATVARAVLLAATASILVMVLVSQVVVRRMIAPLERLVTFVRSASPHETTARADVGDGEIAVLADAFNGLLDRVQRSQTALVRSEKLALAGLFAARVAHDIRNPLSSIKMQTQLLRGRLRTDDDAMVAAVLRDVEQVETVVRDLLELAGPGELRLEPASVNEVVRDALGHLAPQFAHRKIAVAAQLDERIPLLALDRSRLKQALLNLLVNASEAMPNGGTVTVSSQLRHDGAAIEICDSGTGIDPAVFGRLFEPFVSTKPDGVGLGLVNVKAVIDGHGGRIRLQPRDPAGACASMMLPLPPAAATPLDPANG